MNQREKYIEFSRKEHDLPVFLQPWWLDCTCGTGNWDVVLVEGNGNVMAAFPYYKSGRRLLAEIRNPVLTPWMGPYIKYPEEQKYAKRRSFEKKIVDEILAGLPKFNYLKISTYPGFQNWLPFHWAGFRQSTNYTYVLENIGDTEALERNFSWELKKNLRKASRAVEVKHIEDPEITFGFVRKTFHRQGKEPPFSLDFLLNLDRTLKEKGCRRIYVAEDREGNLHGSVYIVNDRNSAYYLLGGGDPVYRRSCANSLLLWEAIREAATEVPVFDFEGSMIEPIERHFRGFGAVQKPYHVIRKFGDSPTRVLLGLRSLLSGKEF